MAAPVLLNRGFARYDRAMPVDTQQIVEAAEKLGKLITEHPVLQKYADAQKAVAGDPETSRLFQQFDAEVAKLGQLEQAGQQMTEQQQMRLQQMQQVIASNLKVKAFSLAQVELTDLLRKVSQAWQKPVAEAQAGRAAGAAPAPAAATAPASSKLIY
jgi:cell fate (sporulation/competence/biofilm development) regulator YlbF (YheA/YmcA/DUF963 family)